MAEQTEPSSDPQGRCATCRWWAPVLRKHGECRRHAPAVAAHINSDAETHWPMTTNEDFCGDHEVPS